MHLYRSIISISLDLNNIVFYEAMKVRVLCSFQILFHFLYTSHKSDKMRGKGLEFFVCSHFLIQMSLFMQLFAHLLHLYLISHRNAPINANPLCVFACAIFAHVYMYTWLHPLSISTSTLRTRARVKNKRDRTQKREKKNEAAKQKLRNSIRKILNSELSGEEGERKNSFFSRSNRIGEEIGKKI